MIPCLLSLSHCIFLRILYQHCHAHCLICLCPLCMELPGFSSHGYLCCLLPPLGWKGPRSWIWTLKEDQKLSESHHNATTLAIPFENQKERKKKKKKVIVCGKIKTYIKRQKKHYGKYLRHHLLSPPQERGSSSSSSCSSAGSSSPSTGGSSTPGRSSSYVGSP